MRAVRLAGILSYFLVSAVLAQNAPLFWMVRDGQVFGTSHTLNGPNGTVAKIPGRDLTALAEAKRRIGEQYNLQPVLVLSNQPGINAFATEKNGQSIVSVNLDTIRAIKDDADMWAALMGHEFGHVYHHHVENHQARTSIIDFAATVLDAYQQSRGRDRAELIQFGAQLIDNAFTREQEREADASSVKYMARAGFNPEGAIRLQKLLLSHYGSSGEWSFLESHPSGEERIRNLRSQIASTPRSAIGDGSVSQVEFKRYMSVCQGEIREAGNENSKALNEQYACLKKQRPRMAKGFVLCFDDLSAKKQLNANTLAECVAKDDANPMRFGYTSWNRYCGVEARSEDGNEAVTATRYNSCLWSNAESLAFRGFLCDAEATQMRVLPENKAAFVRACSNESSEMKIHFDRELWEIACKRKAAASTKTATEQENTERTCLLDAPAIAASSLSPNKSAVNVQQMLSDIKVGWAKTPISSGPSSECDRLASTVPIGDVKQHFVGFIDTVAAEPVCLAAAKKPQDNGRSMVSLAAMYMQQGRYKEAGEWASKAKTKNALNAGTVLAVLAFNGLGGKSVDYARGYTLLVEEAKRGSSDAVVDLAAHIRDGKGVEAQPEAAFELLKLAAEQGDGGAISAIGMMYATGKGVPQDQREAIRLFRQSAEAGYPPANLHLIALLRKTANTDKNELQQVQGRAIEIAKRYASMDSMSAKMMLATIYANGVGVPVDRSKAVDIYKELASREMVSAMMALGFAYLNGAGVQQDKEQAISYFQMAAAHGNKDADLQITRATR